MSVIYEDFVKVHGQAVQRHIYHISEMLKSMDLGWLAPEDKADTHDLHVFVRQSTPLHLCVEIVFDLIPKRGKDGDMPNGPFYSKGLGFDLRMPGASLGSLEEINPEFIEDVVRECHEREQWFQVGLFTQLATSAYSGGPWA